MRTLIKKADPDVVEEWKWVKPTKPGTPVWSHDGIICTGESYKNGVKLTFSKGASLKDPARLFNSSLDGNARRAIDIHEGEEVDESAFKAARSPSGRPQQFWQVETFEESEVLRDSAPGQVRHRGGGGVVPPSVPTLRRPALSGSGADGADGPATEDSPCQKRIHGYRAGSRTKEKCADEQLRPFGTHLVQNRPEPGRWWRWRERQRRCAEEKRNLGGEDRHDHLDHERNRDESR